VAARDGPVAGLLSEQCDVSDHRHLVDGGSGRLERPIARRGLAAPAETGGRDGGRSSTRKRTCESALIGKSPLKECTDESREAVNLAL